MWNDWDKQDKQWKNIVKMQDPVDRALFSSSTYISIGNGRNTPFWEAKWLHGTSPEELVPYLF
jgi:hypothetical protein